MDKIKQTIVIRIDGLPIESYITESGTKYVGKNAERLFKVNSNVPFITLTDANNKTVIAYELQSVVDNVKSKILKYLAKEGLTILFIAGDKAIDNPVQPLSDFDKLLKQALDYNPSNNKPK